MEIEVITIPVTQLQTIITDAVFKGILKSKQNEITEDVYISINEVADMIGKDRSTVIRYCNDNIFQYTTKIGSERDNGKSPMKTRLISKNSVLKFLNNKR